MATFVEVTNAVLRRLRNETVTDFDDTTGSLLISKFVNDAKREVEDAWDWHALRSLVEVSVTTSATNYALSGTNKRTRILWGLNTTHDATLRRLPQIRVGKNLNFSNTTTISVVTGYRVRGTNASDELTIDIQASADSAQTLQFECVIPQVDLTASATEITVPSYPVELGAWAKAISERGEDGGVSFSEAQAMYLDALRNAVSIDSGHLHEEVVWQPV